MQDTIDCPFIFVPDGAPWPTDWIAEHPEHLVLPARFEGVPGMIRRTRPKPSPPLSANDTPATLLPATTAAARAEFGLLVPQAPERPATG